ncbi:MAG TPA: ferritin family protein [Candidatus Edwardsbacteria bacterium]|nr:ferritin family protein [Candidatus Edwardsbacteria bacterium]
MKLRRPKKTMPKALAAALKLEHKGSAFYLKMSQKTGNLLAKQLYDQLALQEIEHIGRINEVFAAVSQGQPWPVPQKKKIGFLESEVKRIFTKLNRAGVRETVDNVSGLKVAMDMEWYSYKMYEKLSREAVEGPEKEFFRLLMQEEAKHYEALSNVYAYLGSDGDWLERSESQTWNWMNL